MALSTQTPRPEAVLQVPTSPKITNLSIPSPATEVPFTVQPGVQRVELRARGSAKLKYSFIAAQSGVEFITIPRGKVELIDGINFTGTIYIQASEAPEVIEIQEWID